MPLIFAIDSDKRQSAQLASLLRSHVEADLVQSASAVEGLETLVGRVPDLILTSSLLSPRDETALANHLRDLGVAAAHVQTLTIPVLAGAAKEGKQRKTGVLASLRRQKAAPAKQSGCDPEVFAREVQLYLERAVEQREILSEALAAAVPAGAVTVAEGADAQAACEAVVEASVEPPAVVMLAPTVVALVVKSAPAVEAEPIIEPDPAPLSVLLPEPVEETRVLEPVAELIASAPATFEAADQLLVAVASEPEPVAATVFEIIAEPPVVLVAEPPAAVVVEAPAVVVEAPAVIVEAPAVIVEAPAVIVEAAWETQPEPPSAEVEAARSWSFEAPPEEPLPLDRLLQFVDVPAVEAAPLPEPEPLALAEPLPDPPAAEVLPVNGDVPTVAAIEAETPEGMEAAEFAALLAPPPTRIADAIPHPEPPAPTVDMGECDDLDALAAQFALEDDAATARAAAAKQLEPIQAVETPPVPEVALEAAAPEADAPEISPAEIVAIEAAPEEAQAEIVSVEIAPVEIAAAEATGPEAIVPVAIALEATGPVAMGSEATGPVTMGPEATGPVAMGPEATGPMLVEPELVAPEIIEPEAVEVPEPAPLVAIEAESAPAVPVAEEVVVAEETPSAVWSWLEEAATPLADVLSKAKAWRNAPAAVEVIVEPPVEPAAEPQVEAVVVHPVEAVVAQPVVVEPVVEETYDPDASASWNLVTSPLLDEREEMVAERVVPVAQHAPIESPIAADAGVFDPVSAAAWQAALSTAPEPAPQAAPEPEMAAVSVAEVTAPVEEVAVVAAAPEPEPVPVAAADPDAPLLDPEVLALLGMAAHRAGLEAMETLDTLDPLDDERPVRSSPSDAERRKKRQERGNLTRAQRRAKEERQARRARPQPRPAEDEWGIYDPAQAGAAALFDDEEWEEEADRRPSRSRAVTY
jgi:hypothetical protein